MPQTCDMGILSSEGMKRIFSSEKSDGFGRERTCVPEASMLTTRTTEAASLCINFINEYSVCSTSDISEPLKLFFLV
jgi:hypothetical protein